MWVEDVRSDRWSFFSHVWKRNIWLRQHKQSSNSWKITKTTNIGGAFLFWKPIFFYFAHVTCCPSQFIMMIFQLFFHLFRCFSCRFFLLLTCFHSFLWCFLCFRVISHIRAPQLSWSLLSSPSSFPSHHLHLVKPLHGWDCNHFYRYSLWHSKNSQRHPRFSVFFYYYT